MKVFHSALKSLSLSFIYFYASVTLMRVTKRKLSWWSIPDGLVWWKEKGKLAPDEWKKFWLRVDHVATGVLIFFGLILFVSARTRGWDFLCVREARCTQRCGQQGACWGPRARRASRRRTHLLALHCYLQVPNARKASSIVSPSCQKSREFAQAPSHALLDNFNETLDPNLPKTPKGKNLA